MNKKILIIPFMLILSMISVYALTCGFSTPANSAVLDNDDIINVSFANMGVTEASISVAFFATSPSTRNSSAALNGLVANLTNATQNSINQSHINTTIGASKIIEDSNDYTLDCTCYNGTAGTACNSTRTSIEFGRTAPSAPASITYTNPVEDAETITATIDRTNANRCFIRFGSQTAERKAMVLSGTGDTQTCTFTVGKNNPPNFDYQSFIEADDRTNSTLSNVQYVTIRAVKADGGGLWGGTLVTTDGLGGTSNPFVPQDKKVQTIILLAVAFFVLKWFKII